MDMRDGTESRKQREPKERRQQGPEEAGNAASDADAVAAEDTDPVADGLDTPAHVDVVAAPEPEAEDDAERELAALRDRHLRLAAEFDNYRRRTAREHGEAGAAARAGLARDLLEVIDDLERVAETPPDGATTEALHEGIGLVARKFAKVLADAGVERLNPDGERFDPNLHDALMMTPTDDPEQDELVSHVVLAGYRLGERLLRPARVTVFRHEEAD